MDQMNNLFKKIGPEEITDNFFQAINKEWMLITAGSFEKFNTMTASWGTIGILWNKPIAICFIRPSRYTYGFVNESKIFTLSFFTEKERSILQLCGTKSGKNVDKITETGLVPLKTDLGGITYKRSRLCLECNKIYYDDLKPANFILPDTDKINYPLKDYHRMFIGEIMNVYIKDNT